MEGGGIKDGRSQGLPCKVSEMCDGQFSEHGVNHQEKGGDRDA